MFPYGAIGVFVAAALILGAGGALSSALQDRRPRLGAFVWQASLVVAAIAVVVEINLAVRSLPER